MLSKLIGIVLIVIGAFFVIKSEALLNAFGRIDFFERKFATYGGSRFGYNVIGLIIIFLGTLLLAGLYTDFMTFVLSPLLRAGQSQ